jgi:hypothetical protein
MGCYVSILHTRQLLEMAAYQQIIRPPFPQPYQNPTTQVPTWTPPTPPLSPLTVITPKHLCPLNQKKNSRGGAVVSTPDLVS